MGDIRKTLDEREYDKFIESPTRANKTAVEVVPQNTPSNPLFVNVINPSSGGGGTQMIEKVPISITNILVNQWVPVVLTMINRIADITVFDEFDSESVIIETRIVNSGTGVEIKSKVIKTFTVHVEGYLI